MSRNILTPIVVARRIVVIVFLIYLLLLVNIGLQYIIGTPLEPLWRTTGCKLFPVPVIPNGSLPNTVPLDPVDYLVYLLFVGNGIWLLWTVLSCWFIFRPAIQLRRENLGQ